MTMPGMLIGFAIMALIAVAAGELPGRSRLPAAPEARVRLRR
jgi:hypothetical protein